LGKKNHTSTLKISSTEIFSFSFADFCSRVHISRLENGIFQQVKVETMLLFHLNQKYDRI